MVKGCFVKKKIAGVAARNTNKNHCKWVLLISYSGM